MHLNHRLFVLFIVLAVAAVGCTQGIIVPPPAPEPEVIEFDVAEDATQFVFDEAPLHDNGMPAHGNSFVTAGYIYPKGTLDGSNGVLPDGSPEFPDQVIGEWVCRGWFIGEGGNATTGPWVITTQVYSLGEEYGEATLVSDGYELSDVNQVIKRAITGGTGEYDAARGEAEQTLLGFNTTEGVNLTFKLTVKSP